MVNNCFGELLKDLDLGAMMRYDMLRIFFRLVCLRKRLRRPEVREMSDLGDVEICRNEEAP